MLSTDDILTGLGLMIVLAIGCQLLAARLRLPAASGVATKRGRAALLVGWAIALGLLADVLVGPILGGVGGEHFLVLWPVFAGIALAVALATAGLQTILGALTAAVACGYDASARKGAPYRGICTHAG